MIWNNRFCGPLFDNTDDGKGGGGDKDDKGGDKSTKIKIGDKEYDPDSARSAVSLYEALQDPETGREIIETLARKAGLLDKSGEIEKKPGETDKQAESRAAKKIKAKLGKDYEKFADSLGPVLDELLEEVIGERTNAAEAKTSQTAWEGHVDAFLDSHVVTKEIEDQMKELMADAPPNYNREGFKASKYLDRMYRAACTELDVEPKTLNKNRRSSSRDKDDEDDNGFVVRAAPKNVTVDDAVEAAMRGIRFERN